MKLLFIIGLMYSATSCFAQQTDSFTDVRDGQKYNTVVIGTQTWTSQNINFDAGRGSFCYNKLEENCAKLGRLYTFAAAQTACPAGWHLPSTDEFKVLKSYIDNNGLDMSTKSGFNSLLGGLYFGATESFDMMGTNAFYWTSTEINEYYCGAFMNDNTYFPSTHEYFPNCGYSVRCLKD